jgi:hypothetical protein
MTYSALTINFCELTLINTATWYLNPVLQCCQLDLTPVVVIQQYGSVIHGQLDPV